MAARGRRSIWGDNVFDREALQTLGWRGGDGNAAYLDKTLLHDGMEVSLDDRVTARNIATLAAYALVASFLSFLPFLFLGLILLVAGGGGAFIAAVVIGWIVSVVVFWVIFLGSKVPEPISEWRVLLDARIEQSDSVYSKIAGTLGARAIPLSVQRRRIRTGLSDHQISNRLVAREGSYVAYISVFSYGTSLYLGWMMWRSRRGWGLIKQYLSDLVLSLTGRADPELLMLRTERPRAMREAVHAACREGLVVAIDQTPVPVEYGFPHGLPPIESGGFSASSGPDLPSSAFPGQYAAQYPPQGRPPGQHAAPYPPQSTYPAQPPAARAETPELSPQQPPNTNSGEPQVP